MHRRHPYPPHPFLIFQYQRADASLLLFLWRVYSSLSDQCGLKEYGLAMDTFPLILSSFDRTRTIIDSLYLLRYTDGQTEPLSGPYLHFSLSLCTNPFPFTQRTARSTVAYTVLILECNRHRIVLEHSSPAFQASSCVFPRFLPQARACWLPLELPPAFVPD